MAPPDSFETCPFVSGGVFCYFFEKTLDCPCKFTIQLKGFTMANTDYANVDAHLVNTGGGCVTISVAAGSTVPCYSVPLPSKIVFISQGLATASVVRFGINSSTTASLGAVVPTVVGPSLGTAAPVEVAVDDVSKIWVNSAVAACLGITYLH